jgi:hypothetical protein
MDRGRHQDARPWRRGKSGADITRVEGPVSVDHKAVLQRQQHGRLEAVAVLVRHRPEHGGVAQGRGHETVAGGPCTPDQSPPGLDVRHRPPRRSGGEEHDRRLARCEGGNYAGRTAREIVRKDEGFHRSASRNLVAKAIEVREIGGELGKDDRLVIQRQQSDVVARQCRSQADREAISVVA